METWHTDLTDKVVVVTGGTGVIGGTFCEALAQCGAKVAILARNEDKGEKLAARIRTSKGQALFVKGDVLNKDSLRNAKEVIHKAFGTCDILINGAGGNHPKGTTSKEYFFKDDLKNSEDIKTFFDLDMDGIDFVFKLNFLGTLLPSQVFAKDMIGKSHPAIINVSSMNASTPLTKIPAYSGAKAAVSNFTQWLAVHMSKVGIRVNAIAPGFFLTQQNEALLTNEDGSYTDRARKILGQTPMERFGEPEELIGTLLWLVDHRASGFVNGVVIPVDGGFSAYSGV